MEGDPMTGTRINTPEGFETALMRSAHSSERIADAQEHIGTRLDQHTLLLHDIKTEQQRTNELLAELGNHLRQLLASLHKPVADPVVDVYDTEFGTEMPFDPPGQQFADREVW